MTFPNAPSPPDNIVFESLEIFGKTNVFAVCSVNYTLNTNSHLFHTKYLIGPFNQYTPPLVLFEGLFLKTYPETRSFGISDPNASAISLEPMFAIHCRARETWTGFLNIYIFIFYILVYFIKKNYECWGDAVWIY